MFFAGIFILILLVEDIPFGCTYHERKQTVRGSSLSPLVEDGRAVLLADDFYECYSIKREDIVEISLGGHTIAKIIKAIPGDKIAVRKSSDERGWHIIINGRVVKNSQAIPYNLSDSTEKLLGLYIKDYNGIIPQEAYLVLGNNPYGTFDSTRFGLVPKSTIIGKIIYHEQ